PSTVRKMLTDFGRQNNFSLSVYTFPQDDRAFHANLRSAEGGEFEIDNHLQTDHYLCLFFAHGTSETKADLATKKLKTSFLALHATILEESFPAREHAKD